MSKPTENPYVGLRAFEEKDAGSFIGREEATRSLLDKLQRHPIVFVSGPLGSGKSSLVFAGVVQVPSTGSTRLDRGERSERTPLRADATAYRNGVCGLGCS